MSSAATAHPLTPADLDTRLAAAGIPIARLIAAARIARSTWADWRAGRTRPRPDRWSATTAAFDALVAEATPAPADVEPEAAGAEPVTLSGSSVPTGQAPAFHPVATGDGAWPDVDPATIDELRRDLDALIAGVLPPGDVVSQSDRARALIEHDRAAWGALCDQPSTDPGFDLAARLDDARDLAVGNLSASPARTPQELAAKASVILAGLGGKPAGWEAEITPYVDLVQSTMGDAVRLAGTAAELTLGPTLKLITTRLAPLIRREHCIQWRRDRLKSDSASSEQRSRLDRLAARMTRRIDRWTRLLMRHVPSDTRIAAVKADAYIELVTAGWTGGTDDLGETLALSVCRDAVRLQETCQPQAAGDSSATLEQIAAMDFAPFDFAGWRPDSNAEWNERANSILVTARMACRFLTFGKPEAVAFVARLRDGEFPDIDDQAFYERVDGVTAFFEVYARAMDEARARLLVAGAALEGRQDTESSTARAVA